MSRLLFIYERDMPTVSIIREMFSGLKLFPEIKSDFCYLQDISPSDIDYHDVIIFIRPDNIYSWKIAQNAKKAGHLIVTFCDDDLLNLPKPNPTIPWRKKGLLKALSFTDVIWSSSRYILEKYKFYTVGKRIALTDTIVQTEEFANDRREIKNDAKVKIVYAAASSHAMLFEEYIGPIVPKLTERFGQKISFTFVSVHPQVESGNCEYVSGMSLLEYRQYMKEQQFDIGVAPLHQDEFSKCKYYNKFLEYTTQGIVGVYSNTEPYTYIVKNRINGILAENNPESWYEALSCLIEDQVLRTTCLANAIQDIRENHSEQACIDKICRGIPEIREEARQYKKCKDFCVQKYLYFTSRLIDWIYLLGFYFKQLGIKAVFNKIKTHFIEAKAYRRKDN